jgi:hypothetical protein
VNTAEVNSVSTTLILLLATISGFRRAFLTSLTDSGGEFSAVTSTVLIERQVINLLTQEPGI